VQSGYDIATATSDEGAALGAREPGLVVRPGDARVVPAYHPAGMRPLASREAILVTATRTTIEEETVLAAWTFGQVMWAMLVFFCWVLFFWLLFTVFGDLFRRHDVSGWGKAGWTIFVVLLPFLGIFVYLIANGKGMAERNMKQAQQAQAQMDQYVKSVAGSGDPTAQIAQAKELLDSGTISQAEFDQLKAKALAA
jgi:hypothetical protein